VEQATTEVQKPQDGDDEFASKADRLSYLLAKLEQAVQAKVAALRDTERSTGSNRHCSIDGDRSRSSGRHQNEGRSFGAADRANPRAA
jgi:hypothetical protein